MSRSLWLYYISEVFLSAGIGGVGFAQPFFFRAQGLDDAHIGLLFATTSFSAGLCGLLLGSVADWLGASRVFKLATLIIPLSYVLTGISQGWAAWLVCAAFTGLGNALLTTTENVVLTSLQRGKERAGVLSRFVALYMGAMGFGAVAGGFLSAWTSYRTALLGAAGVAMAAPVLRAFVRAPDARAPHAFRLPNGRILAMSVYTLLFGIAFGLFNPFATLVLNGVFHAGDRLTSTVSALSTFMISASALAVAGLVRRLRYGNTLALSFGLAAGLTLALSFAGQPLVFSALFLLRAGVMNIPGPLVDAVFLEHTPPTEHAQMFGVRVFGNSLGNAIGSSLGGVVLSTSGHRGMLWASSAMLAAAGGYALWLLRRVTRGAPRRAPVPERPAGSA
ncbi:MFS transporter [Alicyclobacillus macrosporangiidus]|jgi:MFS family permease|uniref:Predicted arabinose efflux permease, MFS family n=1 Tax=Alicyclobacillus macrosporangiidus TaxID=392015 RepID=A0A1I7FAD4_9BACL|nr:MFS transporter [Alicyclobacillus macrosporangiidus]SFU33168.1 Predicted arabinose efflux permease, MFS family [Alicyclobacillus macrosporangiidus]